MGLSRKRRGRPALRYGTCEPWIIEKLPGPKSKVLHAYCVCMITLIELVKRHPHALIRFRGTPDLDDPGVTLSSFEMFDRAFALEYETAAHEYVLNFAPDATPKPPLRRRSQRARPVEKLAQPATERKRPHRGGKAEFVLPMWYKLRRAWRRTGAIPPELLAIFGAIRITARARLQAARQCTRTFMRRLPRLDWRFADVSSLLTGVAEPSASFGVTARLAPMEILIGGSVLLLLQSFETENAQTLWAPSLFGGSGPESERMLA